MSNQPFPLSPEGSEKPEDDNESLEAGVFAFSGGVESGGDSTAQGTPEQAHSPRIEDDGDIDIIFYAAADTAPQPPQEDQAGDEIQILLPAWSDTTISSRMAQPRAAEMASEPPARKSAWRGCMFALIAAAVVLSLLGSSIFSLYWFWNMRSQRAAEAAAMMAAHSGLAAPEGDEDSLPANSSDDEDDRPLSPALLPAAQERVDRIVFVNDNRQIETISPDGGSRRQITSDAKSYVFPAWSTDGRFIAAIGSTISGAGIYRMTDEATGGSVEEVHFSGDEPPFYLYWSPDSRQITYLASDRSADLSLNIIDAGGENASRTIAVGNPMYWNWAEDSRQMLMHSGSGTSDSRLMMIDDFGRPQQQRIADPGPFQAPGISASGRYWAYSQYEAGGTTWLVIDDRTESDDNRRRHAGSVAFSWSPAKDELAFISGSQDVAFGSWGPLRLVDAQSGDIRLLSPDTVLAFFWSPDGRKIATISIPEQNNLGEQFEVRNEKGRRLARFAPDRAPQPAAQTVPHSFSINVIDVASGEGLQLVESSLSAVFLTQFIPYFDQYAHSHQIWSPDSNSIVLPLTEGRQSEITVVDTRNGRATPLAEGSIGFWSRQ